MLLYKENHMLFDSVWFILFSVKTVYALRFEDENSQNDLLAEFPNFFFAYDKEA